MHATTSEEGERVAERSGERVRRAVEDRTWAGAGDRGYVEGLGTPGGTAGERGVALKVDGEEAGRPVVAEAGERVRVCIWVGLRQLAAVSEDETPI